MLLDHVNDRELPADYSGDILLWDIDKTYLDTHFSSVRGLLAIPFEFAIDKQSIPGSVPLLRGLRHGPQDASALVPLYFVSGSPPQLRNVVERRMNMDGVQFDGITFKDQLGLVLARRPKAVKAQIGYKLTALLLYRGAVPAAARWLMFGDDVESDAEVFLLFGEVMGGLRGPLLRARLEGLAVDPVDMKNIARLVADIPAADDPVERVFIHLERNSDPKIFSDSRIVATQSYLQTALVLAHLERIRPVAVLAVLKDLRGRGMREDDVEKQTDDAVNRLGVPPEIAELVHE